MSVMDKFVELLEEKCDDLPRVKGQEWAETRLKFFVEIVNEFFNEKTAAVVTFAEVCKTAESYF